LGPGRRPRLEDQNALEIVSRLARDADVFLDIGAYTGVFTLATSAVDPNLTTHAFEIVPRVADLLEANLRRNGFDGRATVHREGIGVPGTTMLVPSGEGGSALPSFYSSRMHFEQGVSVNFRSLDSLEESLPAASRVLMKIDVEGTEADIFSNGGSFLERHRPNILCEVLHGQADAETLNGILEPLGYQFYLVREHDTLKHPSIQPNPRFRDWLFTAEAAYGVSK
jgi:FkbM family methyltransferase